MGAIIISNVHAQFQNLGEGSYREWVGRVIPAGARLVAWGITVQLGGVSIAASVVRWGFHGRGPAGTDSTTTIPLTGLNFRFGATEAPILKAPLHAYYNIRVPQVAGALASQNIHLYAIGLVN